MKTKKLLLTTFAMLLIVMINGCQNDDFTEITGQSPVVQSTVPVDLATAVPLDQVVTLTFNKKMNPITIDTALFSLIGQNTLGGAPVEVLGTRTYNDSSNTMSFVPTNPLNFNNIYTATLLTRPKVKDVVGNFLQEAFVWTFSTRSIAAPMVISTDPLDNATGVLLNKTVTATFSEPMDPATINTATFTLTQGTTPITGVVTYTGSTASFNPSADLELGTVYTATITSGAKNPLGIAIPSNHVWTFTTETIAPTVISTDPLDNATGVLLNKTVTATFSEPMDPLTITDVTFTLADGTTPITGVVTYTGSTASFNPSADLLPGKEYTATITTGAKNPLGTAIATNHVWKFTTAVAVAPTVISTDPLDNATGVLLNKTVTATFSEPMDPLTISTTTFTLKQGTTSITGVVTYSGSTASFNPSADLLSGKTYTATITTGAKNPGGIAIATDHVWTFTTVAAAPTVISTDPLDKATGVLLNKTVTATFSEPMDPLTITATTFTLLDDGANTITGAITYSGSTASFNPSADLLSGKTYTATITTGAKNPGGIAIATDHVWTFSTGAPAGPGFVDLKSAGQFGILAGVGVSNNAGFSEIRNMDVGISPGVRSSVTGFPPAIVVNGAIFASDDSAAVAAMLIQAKQDLTDAYLFAEGATAPAPATVAGDQGGLTLAPGIYKSTSTLLIQSGDLTLDAQGDANAVWIFQIAADFTTVGGAGGNVILIGGAQAKNIFWQVGSSATIGDGTIFQGNVLALTSITMNSGATAVGRMLARNGAVVMTNANIIEKP